MSINCVSHEGNKMVIKRPWNAEMNFIKVSWLLFIVVINVYDKYLSAGHFGYERAPPVLGARLFNQ